MVEALVDTSVIIDILRGYPPATHWLSTNQQLLGIPRMVILEILEGSSNRDSQRRALKFIAEFTIIEPEQSDFLWATEVMINYGLSHNIDTVDCLIAAPSPRLKISLITRNLKHFRPIIGEFAQSPGY